MMKKLLVILLVSPILLFSTELYENAYMWTKDQGFYKQYRQIAAMTRNVDGKVVIWTEEKELPTMFMLPDYSKNALWAYVGYGTLDSTHVNAGYTRDMATGSYTQNSFHLLMMGKDLYNVYIQNIHGTSQSKILVATSGGVFWTTNDGSSWLPVAQNGFLEKDVMAVTASPANVTSFLPFRSKVYAIGYDGNVHNKTMMTSGTWTKLEGVGKTLDDFENSGDLTTLPATWERVNDDGSHVLRDTTIFEGGNYSLVIRSDNESGDYGASDTLIPSYTRWLVDFSFYMDTVSGVSSFSGGRLLLRNNGYEFEIEFKSDGVYLAGTDTKLDTVVLSSWNHYYLHLDFVGGKARLYGPDANGKEVILDSTTETSCIMFLGPSEPGYTYYIDNFQIGPELFALMHHPSDMNQAFVSAADGIYMRVDSLSKWMKKCDYVGYPARLASDIWGKYYAFIDPEAHKVFFSADSGETWQDVTHPAFDSITLYSVAIDTAGNLYVGTSDYLYCLKNGSSTWDHYTNGFTQYGLADMVSQVLSVVPFTPETIFVGNYNGIYASFNGGDTWVEDNDTVIDPSEKYLTIENIAKLDTIMELGDSTHPGLYDLVKDYIGEYPDVDGDGQVHVLLLDIFDEDENGNTGWKPGYYDFTNEYINDTTHLYSNHKDMIYVDYELFVNDQSITVHDMLDNLVEMVSMWADPMEEGWMLAGFKGYARYLYDIGTDSTDVDSGTYTVTWQDAGTGLIGISEDYYGNIPTYWFMYLRELYGENLIKDIIKLKGYKVVDQMTGRRDSIVIQGTESLDTLLIRKGSNFDDTYSEFVERILKGNLKYYPNLGISYSSYSRIMNHLSTINYYAVTGCLLDSAYMAQFPGRTSVYFNGSDNNDFLLFTVTYSSTGVSVNSITPSDGNKYILDVSDLYNGSIDSMMVFVMSTSNRGTDPSKAFYYLTNNAAVDTTIFSVIVQSPISDRYCRFYTFSTYELYKDIGDERPYLKIDSDVFYMEKMGVATNGQNYYMTDFTIPRDIGTAGIDITLNAEDGAGNVYVDTFHLDVHNVTSTGAKFVAGGYEVIVPENALNGRLTTIASKKSVFLGFNSICGEITLRAPAAENRVFARVETDGAHRIPTERSGDYLVAKVTSPGTYMLVKGDGAIIVPLTYGIEKVSPNPFSNNQIVQFSIPVDTRLTLSVVDVSGRVIKTLMKGEYRAGSYSVVWDGTNSAGKKVSSGIYFVLLNSELGKISHKTVYVR